MHKIFIIILIVNLEIINTEIIIMLKIFNTLTKRKEKFKPINNNTVTLYVCGSTVYDLCHLGHARTFVIFDTIVRYFRYCGYQVKYIRNITDIDDKIIQKANQNNESIDQLTKRMIQEMHVDLDALNILRPDYEPRVTNYIDIIIKFINLLIQKKHAYIASNGDVMFSIKTDCKYGILSGRYFDDKNIKNSFCNKNLKKQKSEDFVLWKSFKPGEPYWMAPWGKGRPGWHIECSAMIDAILGKRFDIHGGGSDLIFPHHDNELAQSSCAYNSSYANIWMHSGMLSLDNEKMSKSLGNFITIRDILKQYNSEIVRYFLLSAHYRNFLKYNNKSLKSAQISLKRLYMALRDFDVLDKPHSGEHFIKKFIEKMNDDFNTPEAYSVLFEMAHELNFLKTKCYNRAQGIAATLKYLSNILGMLYQHPKNYLKYEILENYEKDFDFEKIQKLIQTRENARKHNQWELADKIRKKLTDIHIIVEDDHTGKTKWRFNL